MALTRLLRRLYICEVIGRENLPISGPAILASNHASYLDPMILGISYSGNIRWMAKAELWKVPVFRWLIEKLGAFPVKRGKPDREALRTARELLTRKRVLGMFPQGTRVKGEDLGDAFPGVGMIALIENVPVIPIRVRGHDRVFRRGIPRFPAITITVGEPIDLDITGMSKGRASKEAANRIMEAIKTL
ncbi:1-acyl-sn-glycerol-3-phosphate acyltransferase [candidate division WS5 bacterium]|uniref:1-acyl-sn-glycerol-3-phosphate acyltransferase n=1 Tax=candidate division WS5 bacterium TaxID=2093353 RepID=A0A419DC96_9BACT|nr:MAG: 1-acyl-sn-glycerol-3-phosphate acyltransferase [candidate division WS5 bacterium]